MDANKRVIRDFFKNIGKQVVQETGKTMNDTVYDTLDHICQNLLLDAVIQNRLRNPESHQYTGNLINSIVVILYEKSEGVQSSYFAYDRLREPIRKEMTALTTRGTKRKNAIHFRPDWQNTPHSMYTPEVATDESFGPSDARSFASSWKPSTKSAFEICVAYTSEYAEWVETQRQTTGLLNSMKYTNQVMTSFGFKKIS